MTEERFCHKLGDQPQLIQGPGMLGAGGDEVDAGGLDAGVAQHVSQLCHIPAHPVETPGKQVAQVVGKYFLGFHVGHTAQLLHFQPDLFPGQTLAASGEKDLTGGGFIFFGKGEQLSAQPGGEQIVRILPFRAISAFPACAASRVMQGTSLTRMPVAQIVSISRARRFSPAAGLCGSGADSPNGPVPGPVPGTAAAGFLKSARGSPPSPNTEISC